MRAIYRVWGSALHCLHKSHDKFFDLLGRCELTKLCVVVVVVVDVVAVHVADVVVVI